MPLHRLVGLDETRRLTERARDFLLKYGSPDNILILDAAEFDLRGIDPRFAPYLVPLFFSTSLGVCLSAGRTP